MIARETTNPETEKPRDPANTEISFFSSIRDKEPSGKSTILDYIQEVKNGKHADTVNQIRELFKNGREDEADELKRSLPAFSLSAYISEGGRANALAEGRLRHSGCLQGDFDLKDFEPRKAQDVKQELIEDEYSQAVFLSPGGGVKVVIRTPVCHTAEEHASAFEAAEAYYQNRHQLKLDTSTKDPVRLSFHSYDPEAYFRPSPAKVLEPATPENNTEKGLFSIVEGCADGSCKADTFSTRELGAMLACIPPRPDYSDWLRIASAVWAATPDETTGTKLLEAWSPEERPGEYSSKYQNRLNEITVGTLLHIAKKNGYQGGFCVAVPDDVFPVPAGEVSYGLAGDIIFGSIAPTHQLLMRGGVVHEVIDDGKEPAYFKPLTPERLCSIIENFNKRVARLEAQNGVAGKKTKGGRRKTKLVWRSTRMPVSHSKILLESNSARENLPSVRQLVACPVLTNAGELLARGYNPHAGGTYITGGSLPSEQPLELAVILIKWLLHDFNFVTPSDKSRAVASILSPALKMGEWIKDDFPMDVAEANQSQSGKTYRQKIVNCIYNEVPSAITAPRGGVGSLDETISSALIKGRPFITLDNFRGKLDSTILEQAIRGMKRVSCRALRTSADVDTQPFNWQLSTNGAEFTRDIANRSIITRIRKQDAEHKYKELPEGDLLAHVAANQPLYLGAVFSVLEEWRRVGCPRTNENRHDFRSWCQSLDWIVQRIFGLTPLLDGHREEQMRTANPALQWVREVANAISVCAQLGSDLTTTQIVSIAEDAGIDFPGNPLSQEEPHQRAGKILGRVFRDSDGQPVSIDGFTVQREERNTQVEGRGYEDRKFYTFTSSPQK